MQAREDAVLAIGVVEEPGQRLSIALFADYAVTPQQRSANPGAAPAPVWRHGSRVFRNAPRQTVVPISVPSRHDAIKGTKRQVEIFLLARRAPKVDQEQRDAGATVRKAAVLCPVDAPPHPFVR